MSYIEMNAADAMMDRRLKINVPAPWLLRLFGKKTIPVYVKRPVGQNLCRMAKLYVKMDIDLVKLKNGEMRSLLECIGRNAVTVSRIIAHGMIRGNISSFLLNRPLAYYLRSNMDMRSMAELAKIIVLISTGEDFVSIIASLGSLRLTEVTESQTAESGS